MKERAPIEPSQRMRDRRNEWKEKLEVKERPNNLQGYFELFEGNRRTIPDKDTGTETLTDMSDVVRPAIEVLFLQNTETKLTIVEQKGMDGANEVFMPQTVKKNSNH